MLTDCLVDEDNHSGHDMLMTIKHRQFKSSTKHVNQARSANIASILNVDNRSKVTRAPLERTRSIATVALHSPA